MKERKKGKDEGRRERDRERKKIKNFKRIKIRRDNLS